MFDGTRSPLAGLVALGGVIAAAASTLVGGWDKAMFALLGVILLDFITAWMLCCIRPERRKLDSTLGWKGVVKKVGYLIAVIVAVLFDRITGMQVPLARTIVVMFLFANDALSILEHLALMGVPVPAWLIQRLGKIKEDNNNGGNAGSGTTNPPTEPAK